MALKERLQAALDASGKSRSELARACGVSRAAVTEWMTGRTTSLTAKNLRLASEFLDVSAVWLEVGVGPMRVNTVSADVRLAARATRNAPVTKLTLPRLAPSTRSGLDMTNEEDELVESLVACEPALRRVLATAPISSLRNLRVLTAQGDAMSPTFKTGDLLLVDAGVNNVRADGIYALIAQGELQVRRVQRRGPNLVVLISDNKYYLPTEAAVDAELHVLGRVILVWNGCLV